MTPCPLSLSFSVAVLVQFFTEVFTHPSMNSYWRSETVNSLLFRPWLVIYNL